MKFWAGAEVEKSVDHSLDEIRRLSFDNIADNLAAGTLAEVTWELCYIPIVMGPEFTEFFPPRTSMDERARKLFYSPQLDFDVFRAGTFEQRMLEYMQGLVSVEPLLVKAGLSDKHVIAYGLAVKKLVSSAQKPLNL